MSAKLATEKPLSEVLIDRWEHVAQKFAELAQELPAEEWAPVVGLRNCGGVLRHVAFWNGYVTGSLRGRHFTDAANQLPAADYQRRRTHWQCCGVAPAKWQPALWEHRGGLTSKSMELVTTFVEHASEHYGQLVVYGRLMGMVPPASRT